jgi:hypothetical protein
VAGDEDRGVKHQLIDQAPTAWGLNDRLAPPMIGRKTITDMRV